MGLSVNRKKHFFLFSFLSRHDYVGMVLATLNETESQKGLPLKIYNVCTRTQVFGICLFLICY